MKTLRGSMRDSRVKYVGSNASKGRPVRIRRSVEYEGDPIVVIKILSARASQRRQPIEVRRLIRDVSHDHKLEARHRDGDRVEVGV
jgi:hypothetical protein